MADRGPRLFVMILTAIGVIGTLAGCGVDPTPSVSSRHVQPLSEKTAAELEKKNMGARSPILIRIFKEEAELELWKENDTGRFALFRTYPICRWSGELGPKIKTGDRQAPEGFYSITPEQMNPNSNYYLAFNIGFPNTYDRANGRTGGFLMVHGDCASVGCYAMTDEQIAEIYALARESFAGGQKSFQVQAYPFRMTPLNMARHRNSPHAEFWKMLKDGHDHFEVTHLAPKVDVCDRRYVFDAETPAGFSPLDRCPAYKMREDVEAAVREKQRRDEGETARLISAGMPIAPTNGGQGGMNRIFLAAISQAGAGVAIRTAAGTIPSHVHPPSRTASQGTDFSAAEPSAASENGLLKSAAASTSADQIGTLVSDRLQ